MIAQVMSKEGPIVTAVHITAEGVAKEVTLDMTPKKDEPAKLLGGTISIEGSYPDMDVVVMARREPENDTAANPHKLPSPFDRKEIKGSMVLVRMDEEAEPKPLTLKEYEAFCEERKKNPLAEDQYPKEDDEMPQMEEEDDGEDDGEDDDDEEDEDDDEDHEEEEGDEDEEDYFTTILDLVSEDFNKAHGRMPTTEELEDQMEKYNDPQDDATKAEVEKLQERAKVICAEKNKAEAEAEKEAEKEQEGEAAAAAAATDAPAEDGGGAPDIMALIKGKLESHFEGEMGRKPTEEELGALIQAMAGDQELHADLEKMDQEQGDEEKKGQDDEEECETKRKSPGQLDGEAKKKARREAVAEDEQQEAKAAAPVEIN